MHFLEKKHALTERSDFAAKPPTDVMKISFIQKNLSGERYLKIFDGPLLTPRGRTIIFQLVKNKIQTK